MPYGITAYIKGHKLSDVQTALDGLGSAVMMHSSQEVIISTSGHIIALTAMEKLVPRPSRPAVRLDVIVDSEENLRLVRKAIMDNASTPYSPDGILSTYKIETLEPIAKE